MYRSQTTDLFSDGRNKNITTTWRAAASYVTGRQSLKVGLHRQPARRHPGRRTAEKTTCASAWNNGVPNQFTTYIHNQQNDLGCAARRSTSRISGTLDRLTLSGALRYDHASSWAPEQTLESRFFAAPLSWERTPVVDSYNDITPRFSAAYDLFGNGKTAIKGTLGKYLESTVTASNYSLGTRRRAIATNSAAPWTDGNRNWVPGRDSAPPRVRQHRRGWRLLRSGREPQLRHVELHQHHRPGDPARVGRAPSDWSWGVSVQQEVLPRSR
jgi:hypothetical protein